MTLSTEAYDEVKVIFSAMHLFIKQLYSEYLNQEDMQVLKEDIAKAVIEIIVQNDIYRVLICL